MLFFCLAATLALAAPFATQFAFTQPNGLAVRLMGWGDEFHADFETSDGYTVLFDHDRQAYVYATLSENGSQLVASNWLVGTDDPVSHGLTPHLRDSPSRIHDEADARVVRWNSATRNSERWRACKAALQRTGSKTASTASTASTSIALAPPAHTSAGTQSGLCLLIDFDDDTGTVSRAEIANFCNGDSYSGYGNNGSVKKYFLDNSNGLLTYTNIVTAYVRIPNSLHPKSYYNNTSNDCAEQANLLIRDAVAIMKALPNYSSEIAPAFSNLTRDANGRIAACNVFYAGNSSGVWGYGLWPHSWSLQSVGEQVLVEGVDVYDYQITAIGSALELGTFCHENGHMLCGYPDLYDYGYDSYGGAGMYCLMAYGYTTTAKTNPAQICAYLKRASGWATTTDLDYSSVLTTTVSSAGADFNHFYRYVKPGASTEYYLVENRQKAGRDANIRDAGIAIWHIDEQGDRDNQSLVYNSWHANFEVTLVQADNLWHLENNVNVGGSNDLFRSGNTASGYSNSFRDTSAPSARWWDGTPSGVIFSDFSASGTNMTFAFRQSPLTIFTPTPLAAGTVGQPYAQALVAYGGTPPYTWSIASNAPPAGLSLSGNTVTGTPTEAGTALFRLQVDDSASAMASAVFSLSVVQPRTPPFSEGFENDGDSPSGWSQEYVSNTVDWAFLSGSSKGVPAAAHGGTYNALFCADRRSNDATRLVSPMLNLGDQSQAATLTFWHCMANRSGGQDELRVYSRTNAVSGWTPIAAYTNDTSTWTLRTVPLPSPSPTYFIAFEGVAASGYGVCVDDVTVTSEGIPPVIQTPSTLPAGLRDCAYGTNFTAIGGTAPYAWSVVSNSLPPGLTLRGSGLLSGTPEAATNADFGVCVVGGNGKASTNFFHLSILARLPVPFFETFENGGAIPSGWTQLFVTNATGWLFQPGGYNSHPAGAHGGTYNALLYVKSRTPQVTRLISPALDFGGSTDHVQLTFWHCMQLWSTDQDELRLYCRPSPTNGWLLLASFATNTASWTQRTILLPSPSRAYWIAFEGVAKYGYGVCIDDVSVSGTATPHAAWMTNHFTAAEAIAGTVTGDRSDPDGDGIPNLLEYALGLDPCAADTDGAPTGGVLDGHLTLRYRQNKLATDIAYRPQSCTNLGAAAWSTNNISQVSRADSNAWWSVTVRHDTPLTNAPSRFMRLRVDVP